MSLSGVKPHDDAKNTPCTESGSTCSKPAHDAWHSVFEVRGRELGCGHRYNGVSAFTRKVRGSVNFARKLTRYATLNGHSGCVNALHFNESGDGSFRF